MEQLVGIDRAGVERRPGRQGLGQVGEPDQQQEEKGYGGEQRVERERARQERNVVFVGGLQGAEEKPAR
jgi:hypothetical protein